MHPCLREDLEALLPASTRGRAYLVPACHPRARLDVLVVFEGVDFVQVNVDCAECAQLVVAVQAADEPTWTERDGGACAFVDVCVSLARGVLQIERHTRADAHEIACQWVVPARTPRSPGVQPCPQGWLILTLLEGGSGREVSGRALVALSFRPPAPPIRTILKDWCEHASTCERCKALMNAMARSPTVRWIALGAPAGPA